jgi:hypothetical protein
VGLLIFIAAYERWLKMQPTYEGELVSYWVDGACRANPGNPDEDTITAIGPPAVPYLIAKLKTKDSGLRDLYTNLLAHLPANLSERLPQPDDPAVTHAHAANLLGELALCRINSKDSSVISALQAGMKDTNMFVSDACALALWKFDGQYERPALTSIVARLADYSRRNAGDPLALMQIFNVADGAQFYITNSIPLLKELQQSDDSDVRQIATQALKDIADKSKTP